MFNGAVHDRRTEAFAPVAASAVGAPGTVYAEVLIDCVGVPTPATLIAKTRRRIGVPFVKPVIVAERTPPVLAAAAVHVMPPSNDCSTR